MLLFSVIMTKVMWKYWIFTFGSMLFSLGFKDDIIPQHAEGEIWPLLPVETISAQLWTLFFFFKSAGITKKMRKKSHLSSVQQKQHILTSHSVCKMLFPEKVETSQNGAVFKCERWSTKRFHFDTSTTILFLCHRVPEPTLTSSLFFSFFFTLIPKKAALKMDVHVSWKVYVSRDLRFAFNCGANLISTPSLHFQTISNSSASEPGSWSDFCGADLSSTH